MIPHKDDKLFERYTREFKLLANDQDRINFQLTKIEAWFLLSQLQLALRHPKNTGPTAEYARQFAKALERMIAVTPALAEVARRGWDPNYDSDF